MDVTMPDGTVVQGVPDGITKSQLLAKYQKYSAPTQPDLGSAFVKGAYSPFKPIVDNSLDALKSAATSTGEAISEPLNSPSANGAMAIPDAAVRALGKAGNAIAGAGESIFAPVTGALSASAEPTIPLQAKAIASLTGQNPDLTPEQIHNIAQQEGGWAASGVGAAMGANQGAANLRQQQGLPPLPSPSNPLSGIQAGINDLMKNTASGGANVLPTPPKPKPYAPEEIKSGAVNYYNSSEAKGGMMHPDALDKAINQAKQSAGYQSDEGKAFAGDNIVTKTLSDLDNLSGKPMSLKGAGEVDDELGDRIGAAFRAGNNDQASKLMKIRDSLRSAYTNAGEGDMVNPNGFADWRTGDKLWSAYRAGDDIKGIIENGEKADVPSTAIKNGFKTFVKNDKNRAGLTDDEWAAANHAAKTGIVTAALKTAGSKIISGIAGGSAGAFGGGIPGALAGAAVGEATGYPLRLAATALQRGRGQNVIDMIGSRPSVREAMMNMPQSRGQVPPSAAPNSPISPAGLVSPELPLSAPVNNAKFPITNFLKGRGGVKVGSNLDAELRNMGVTPSTSPGLFSKNGKVSDVDNIPLAEWKFGNAPSDETGNYVNRQHVLDSLNKERSGGKPAAGSGIDAGSDADLERYAYSLGITTQGKSRSDIMEAIHEREGMMAPFKKGGSVKKPNLTAEFLARTRKRA